MRKRFELKDAVDISKIDLNVDDHIVIFNDVTEITYKIVNVIDKESNPYKIELEPVHLLGSAINNKAVKIFSVNRNVPLMAVYIPKSNWAKHAKNLLDSPRAYANHIIQTLLTELGDGSGGPLKFKDFVATLIAAGLKKPDQSEASFKRQLTRIFKANAHHVKSAGGYISKVGGNPQTYAQEEKVMQNNLPNFVNKEKFFKGIETLIDSGIFGNVVFISDDSE